MNKDNSQGSSLRNKGWYSRKNETSEANLETNRLWRARKARKLSSAKERTLLAEERTPREQVKKLDEKLGKGKGAMKERVRLEKLVNNS